MSKHANIARTLLIQRLSDGQFHSGETLGKELGLTRAAISKHIKVLKDYGLDVFSVTGKGYRLASPMVLLSHSAIAKDIPAGTNLEVLNIIDSTNQYIKQRIDHLHNGHTCLAEAQTNGRGRHGRAWVSPYGASMYLSMFWSFAGGYQAISGLSLVVGIAINQALVDIGIAGVKLKWPNDVYLQGRKLAGVLIEAEGQLGEPCQCVIGIGLNVQLPKETNNIDQPWTDLSSVSDKPIDRNQLASVLINQLLKHLTRFQQDGLAPFVDQWQPLDFFYDKPVKLLMGNKEITGINKGINQSGAMLLDVGGKIEPFHGGEISVRAN